MKKLLAVSFCTTLALGFASSAFAIHMEQPEDTSGVVAKGGMVTLDGSVRMRGWAQRDADKQDDSAGDTQAYDGRYRLGATIKTSDAVTGRILLENRTSEDVFEGNYKWGMDDPARSLHYGGEKQNGPELLEGWIQYVPGNWGIKVGHMPLALGNKLFFDHTLSGDDALVAFINPNEQMHLAALTIKFQEGLTYNNDDDLDGYVLLGTYKANEAANLGIWYTYLRQDKKMANIVYPPGLPAEAMTVAALPGLSMSNLGLTLDGKMNNISYKLDYEGQFGKLVNTSTMDLKAKGWAALGEVSMGIDSSNIGALIGYGSGDNDSTDNKQKQFVAFLGQTRYQSTMVGYRLPTPGQASLNTGLANLLLVQVNGATDVTCPVSGKDLNLMARLNWMKLNKTPSGVSDEVGTEVELFATWALDNGLAFGFEGAYLFAGKAYEEAAGIPDKENAWFARTFMEIAF